MRNTPGGTPDFPSKNRDPFLFLPPLRIARCGKNGRASAFPMRNAETEISSATALFLGTKHAKKVRPDLFRTDLFSSDEVHLSLNFLRKCPGAFPKTPSPGKNASAVSKHAFSEKKFSGLFPGT